MFALNALTKFSIEHNDILNWVQIFENELLTFFDNIKKHSEKNYLKIVTPWINLFKIGLWSHFKFEVALFPIMKSKSNKSEEIVSTFIMKHSMIMSKFKEFEKYWRA